MASWERIQERGRILLVRDRLERYHLDEAGRPLGWVRAGRTYRRGLDGTVLELRRRDEGPDRFHDVRRLESRELTEQLELVRHRLREAGEPVELDWEADAARFRQLYGRVGILPPDQYASLVLQLTRGCSYNRCSFCSFFRQERFEIRSGSQFRSHLEAARRAFGAGLTARRGTFLGDASAASISTPALLEGLRAVREAFPTPTPQRLDQVGAFLDTFTTRRSESEWSELAAAGLREVYLGVESGCKTVLKLLRKPGHPRLVEQLVERLKAAGLGVNVILMTGAGGRELADEHTRASAALLARLPLGPGDRVYLSDLEVHPGSDYAALNLTALNRRECRQQAREIRQLAGYAPPPRGPGVTLYDIRQFTY